MRLFVQEQIYSAQFFQIIYHFFDDFQFPNDWLSRKTTKLLNSAILEQVLSEPLPEAYQVFCLKRFLQEMVWWGSASLIVKKPVVMFFPFYAVDSNIFQTPLSVKYVNTSKHVYILTGCINALLLVYTLNF